MKELPACSQSSRSSAVSFAVAIALSIPHSIAHSSEPKQVSAYLLTAEQLPDTITVMTRHRHMPLSSEEHFTASLTKTEKRLISRLETPYRIQLFLDDLSYGTKTIYRSPLRVLHEATCQCFDGAVFAAAML
ncbi:MAG TPA: hypothetical protein VEP69_04725, partial [Thermodesulfovibrionales bacterium]|nr:hypothetical protein [Thermodesulfovibrionales bacterium]